MEELIIITGANGGLGFELTKLFLYEQKIVVAVDVKQDKLKRLAKTTNKLLVCSLDISRQHEYVKLTKMLTKLPPPRMLINNAAFAVVEDVTIKGLKDVKRIVDTNLFGTIAISNIVIERKERDNSLKIVNVLSSCAYKGNRNYVYASSKWGIRGLSMSLCEKYKNDDSICVYNAIPCAMQSSYWDNKSKPSAYASFSHPSYVAEFIFNHVNKSNKKFDEFIVPSKTTCYRKGETKYEKQQL